MQMLFHISDTVARRLKAGVPARQRSAFVEKLIEDALPPENDDWLYQIALGVQADEALNAEMAEWDAAAADGLDDLP